jgi:hypothetical protein
VQLPWPVDEFLAKSGPAPSVMENRRRFARVYYRTAAALLIKSSLPAIPRPPMVTTVYVSDISRGSIRLLVDRVFYPEERLTINIPMLGLKHLLIRRCRRVGERCYELGAEFGAEVSVETAAGVTESGPASERLGETLADEI